MTTRNNWAEYHLNRIQSSIKGALRTSPSEALNTILHLYPIDHYIMIIFGNRAVRLNATVCGYSKNVHIICLPDEYSVFQAIVYTIFISSIPITKRQKYYFCRQSDSTVLKSSFYVSTSKTMLGRAKSTTAIVWNYSSVDR